MPSLNDIRERATDKSFSRGEDYYQRGMIFDTVRRGHDLEARCHGSDYAPYFVRVTLDEAGHIADTGCSCPYDWGGDCKHIVALLLTYLHEPEKFEERTPLPEALAARSRDELIALVHQMLAFHPDLRMLIDHPTPTQQPNGTPVDTAAFRHKLRQALYTYDNWGARSPEQAIASVAAAAQHFSQAGDWRNASAIYRAILEESLSFEEELIDEDGRFLDALAGVLEQLASCLDHAVIAEDETERRAVLYQLLDAYIWDISMGGYGLCDEVMPDILLAHARLEDIPSLRTRILDAQHRQAQQRYGSWGVGAYEELLIELDALNNPDPAVVLQRLRENGMYQLLYRKLLTLERIDEAVAVLTEHLTGPFERPSALSMLTAAGHDDRAVQLARDWLNAAFDDFLADWLAERYTARGDQAALCELLTQTMKHNPTEQTYLQLKEVAEALGTWATLQPEIIHQLQYQREFAVLARVQLCEENWDAAWEALEQAQQGPEEDQMFSHHLDLEVAQRSARARPAKAIPVLVAYARRAISRRKREHYAQAASYLATVRDLYQQTGDDATWRALIDGIRQEFARLPALQDELNKAGL
jgi:uncharacterized Zn finger protein